MADKLEPVHVDARDGASWSYDALSVVAPSGWRLRISDRAFALVILVVLVRLVS